MIKNENYTLSNNVLIPKVGFGTWQVKDGEEAYQSVVDALNAGYTSIDTAYVYGNEESVGKAIKDSGIDRKSLFITTKLPSDIKTYDGAIEYFNRSLKNLGLEYLDLFLIHAPWPWSNVGEDCTEGNIEAWKAMIKLYNDGLIRSIGVSNFQPQNIKPLIEATGFVPHVNQIRFFIGNTQEATLKYCQENNILVEAYSPLATGKIVDDPKLQEMAVKYNTTIPKICIRYCVERGTRPLPKSVHKERIIQNIDLDFSISKEDMEYLNSLDAAEDLKKPLRS